MKPASLSLIAVVMTVSLAACGPDKDDKASPADRPPTEAEIATGMAPGEGSAPMAKIEATPTSATTPSPAIAGAPAFATVYPGAVVEGEPVTADGAAGPGGLLTFGTDASPETVVSFYRQRAEAAGLASMMSMNQGDTRAYGASDAASGARLEVVASPQAQGSSVQLSWSAGQ